MLAFCLMATPSHIAPADLSFSVEDDIDFEDTAKIANASFGFKRPRFSAAFLRWLYGKAFGGDTTVVVAKHADKKIGQATILWHPISIDGASHRGAQLIDLFVAPEYRSYEVVAGIYSSLRDQLKAQENCVVVTLPNDKATVFNKRFLKLRNGANLRACVGLAVPRRGQVRSAWVSSTCADDAVALMRSGIPAYRGIAVEWTPQRLLDRLSNPGRRYAVHRSGGLLAVTSFQVRRGVPCFLICGLFADPARHSVQEDLRAILWKAAMTHRWPLYCYLGTNAHVTVPGIEIPPWLHPPERMQLRIPSDIEPSAIARFEALDFDLA